MVCRTAVDRPTQTFSDQHRGIR